MSFLNVLLVEDDRRTPHNLRAALDADVAREPLRIGHARTLGEAVERLAREPAECVVADLLLPDSSGLATYRALRHAVPTIPIVLLTAPGDEAVAAEALSLGADDCLPGNAAPEQIERAVRHALLRARSRAHAVGAEQLEAVLDCVPDAYLTVDAAGLVTYANRAAERFFATPRTSLVGHRLADALPALAGTRLHAALTSGVPAAAEFEEHLPALGLWVDARVFPTPAGNTAALRTGSAPRDGTLHQRVLDAAPVGISIAEVEPGGFPVRYVNPALERMTGHSRDEIIGGEWPLIPGADPAATRLVADAVAAGEPARLELSGQRSDGTPFWNDLALAPVRDGDGRVTHYVAIQRDVSERRRAEDELHEARHATAALLRNLPGMAYRCANDADWTVEFASEGALDLLGVSAAQLMEGSVRFGDLIHPDDRGRVWDEIQTALAENRPFELTYRIVTPAGREKWVWEQGRAVPPEAGGPAALEGFVSNATRQKTLEEQLRQAQKMDALGRLAGGVAHDFNNLLTAIKGTASLMLLDLAPEDPLYADAEEISTAVERAAALTRQLLAFGRGHVGQTEVVDLGHVVTETGRMLRRMIDTGIELSTVLAPDLGAVSADPGQIEQVLVNLVLNARDAMPGGGTVVVETMNLTVDRWPAAWATGLEPGPYVMLVVNDTGTGIEPAIMDRIFEPFFSTKERGKGTGLGLSIVYGIVQQSGGTVRVHSAPGRGTTVRVLLPRVAELPTPVGPPRAELTIPTWTGTVLLVDDEPAVRRATRRMLERTGLTVHEAGNGEEALQWLRDNSVAIDLLVTDVVMPLMGGPALAERMAIERPGTPVLFVSGYTEQNAFRDGATAEGRFLHKPFTWEALTDAAGKLLGFAG
ncbi:MAG TPA: response regulator [Longimicrobium sp.]|nr:response regulator [Longimicrobium sp.]